MRFCKHYFFSFNDNQCNVIFCLDSVNNLEELSGSGVTRLSFAGARLIVSGPVALQLTCSAGEERQLGSKAAF